MLLLVLLNVLLALIPEYAAINLPPYIPRCYVDDPKMNDCLLNATIVLKPYIRKGIKEIGIPSYDPVVISNLGVVMESNLANFTATGLNFTIRGMDNYDITEIQYDPETMTFSGRIEFDPVAINSIYEADGAIASIPISGKGTVRVDLGPINGTFEIIGKMMKNDSTPHYNPVEVKIRLSIDDFSVNADGLFDGNVELGTRTNELVNRNSRVLLDAATPAIETFVEKFLMRYMKWLTKTYSYYTLFPRSKH